MGRKRESKLRADEQEPDKRRCRSGRAGKKPRSSCGQGSGGVNPAVVQGRSAFLPGEISPHACTPSGVSFEKGDGASRSEKSAAAIVIGGWVEKAETADEGPKERKGKSA